MNKINDSKKQFGSSEKPVIMVNSTSNKKVLIVD
jgi:hypothetical protein